VNRNAKVSVVGAGQMGLGIAHAFAVSGFRVSLVDVSSEQLKKAEAAIHGIVAEGVSRGKIDATVADAVRGRLETTQDLAGGVKDCDLVVETATENLPVKLKIIETVDSVVSKDAIVATNTSALSITEIAAISKHPERVVGMHFFNPVHKMKLVEIIKGIATTDAVVEEIKAYSDAIGKTSIVVNEAPGFTTSRMSSLLGNEAMWMLSEGVASAEDIDTSLRMAFNHPMGPLELGDMTGWDTRLSVIKYLHQTLGERFRPCPLIIKMVAAGRYGRKVGHGVYKYENGQKVPNSGLKPY
jgi:3-hydroxybutyryl-CoA dehydrogenase